MSIQRNVSQAEGNIYSRRSLTASLNLSRATPSRFLFKLCKLTLLVVASLALSCGSAAPAKAAILWYNGDPDGQSSAPNYRFWTPYRTLSRFILEDFTVPTADAGWDIDTIWSDNLIYSNSTFSQVSWDILTVRPPEQPGQPYTYNRYVAGGRGPATISPTNFQVSGQPVVRVSISGLNVRLDPGTYWLVVAPFFDVGDSFSYSPSAIATTSGTNAIGTPAGNNGNSFRSGYEPLFSPDTADYSMGIEGSVIPEPSSMFSLLGFGALTLGFRWWRKQQLTLGANQRASDSD